MTRTVLLVLVVVLGGGCSNPDTRCGQVLDDSMSAWLTVSDLRAAEEAFVGGVLLVSGDARVSTPGEACKWLAGLRVVIMDSPTWVDEWGRTVSGLAYPGKDWTLTAHSPGGVVMVGRSSSWRSSSLVHEWLHVVEGGIPATPCSKTDDSHCGWGRVGGEYALIDALAF